MTATATVERVELGVVISRLLTAANHRDEVAEMDRGYDGGEWSGPAHELGDYDVGDPVLGGREYVTWCHVDGVTVTVAHWVPLATASDLAYCEGMPA